MPTTKRRGGSQPRMQATMMLALIDRACASDKGLWPSHFCKDNDCDPRTLTRYIEDLACRGFQFDSEQRANGVWKYRSDQPPLFTPHGVTAFTRN